MTSTTLITQQAITGTAIAVAETHSTLVNHLLGSLVTDTHGTSITEVSFTDKSSRIIGSHALNIKVGGSTMRVPMSEAIEGFCHGDCHYNCHSNCDCDSDSSYGFI